jgi:undecaprenyl-diphosphatase
MLWTYHAIAAAESVEKCSTRDCVSAFIAFLLGLVEGLTEYLPVSSTGHLLLTSRLLGLDSGAIDSFDIVIQFGAILAVVVHYRTLLLGRAASLVRGEAAGRDLLLALVVAFLPTAVAGLLLRKVIKRVLFGPVPVLIAMVVGGMVILAEARLRANETPKTTELAQLSLRQALIVGLGQCFALVPGASRSLCSILAGRAAGLSMTLAAEFSFLLGLPTLGAACIYEGYKERHALATLGVLPIGIGLVTSFLVAWAVIAVFIRYLGQRGLVPFGVYRIVVGALGLLYIARMA